METWRHGDNAASICLALQPTIAAISFSQQVALAGNEELVQTQA